MTTLPIKHGAARRLGLRAPQPLGTTAVDLYDWHCGLCPERGEASTIAAIKTHANEHAIGHLRLSVGSKEWAP